MTLTIFFDISVPEELEIDDSESQDCGVSSGSMREAPPVRKAYSSPIQRMKSVDAALDQCTAAAGGSRLGAQPFDIAQTNCGINEDSSESLKVAQTKANDSVKLAVNRHAVDHGLLQDINNELAVYEENVQYEPSHNLKAMKENSLESKQSSPSKIEMSLQPSLDSATCTEKSALSDVKSSRSKKNNSCTLDRTKRNKLTAGREYSSQDLQSEGNAFGPDLNVTTWKNNEHFPDTSQNNLQGWKEEFTSLNMLKCLAPVTKNDISLKHSSRTVNSVISSVEHVTESKLQNLTVTQHQPLRDTSSALDTAAEVKSKRSLQQTKKTTETAEKHVSMRKKSKCEEKSGCVDSLLAVLTSLAGKGTYLFCT